MNRKSLLFASLILTCVAVLFSQVYWCFAQQSSGNAITSVNPPSGAAGAPFTVNVQGRTNTTNGAFKVFLEQITDVSANGTADGNIVNTNLAVPAIVPGTYTLILEDVASGAKASLSYSVVATGLAAIPTATILILLVAAGISFANMTLNRVLITKMIGWHEYRTMQKEIQEHNSARMAALRANDQKALERLKKKDSQINAMQQKMLKPNMLLLPISLIYFVIWPFLTGFFPFAVAYVPGFGTQPFFIWYLLCSFFFGTIASRVFGVTPIQ